MTFHARQLSNAYDWLGDLPDVLYEATVTSALGSLEERVQGVVAWRSALLQGKLPEEVSWPGPPWSRHLRGAVTDLDVLRFCHDRADVVDPLLVDILASLDRGVDLAHLLAAKELNALRELEAARKARPHVEESCAERASATMADELRLRWQDHVRAWAAITDVFGELGDLLGLGWDLSGGVLQHHGWQDLVALRRLLDRREDLRRVLDELGRTRQPADDGTPGPAERVFEHVLHRRWTPVLVRTPQAPTETSGITHSADVARMLSTEAAFLGHRVLRKLWYARLSERNLATYLVDGRLEERRERPVSVRELAERPTAYRPHGPIVLCVDTSGSMAGVPERVAKALALHAATVAHRQRRSCLVVSWSGPSRVLEHDLALRPEGLESLLAFLGMSFQGGTDIEGVLRHIATKMQHERWCDADVVIVTDGEFPPPTSAVLATLASAKRDGLQIHGVLVGAERSVALQGFADHMHRITSWLDGEEARPGR